MDYLSTIILGVIEGVTEFLPISSTGHLILTAKVLNLQETDFLKTFEISIQLGAILSVVVLYWRKLLVNFEILKRVCLAFIPTGILGLLFYKIVKTYLMGSQAVVLWALLLGGIFLIVFEYFFQKRISTLKGTLKGTDEGLEKISYQKSFLIGVFQSIAMIPGVSRSAATIIGGLSMGISRKTIVEFSFLLAVPTMVAATGLDLIRSAPSFTAQEFGFLTVGFVVSFLVAILAIKWLIKYIQNHSFIVFGIYRVLISLLFLFLIL